MAIKINEKAIKALALMSQTLIIIDYLLNFLNLIAITRLNIAAKTSAVKMKIL